MPSKTVERAPEVACYRCGSVDIYSVCHHCAKPMCEKHSPFAFRTAGKLARSPGASGKPASAEYGPLKLDSTQAAVYHCEEHDHTVRGQNSLTIIGAIVAVIGLIVVAIATVPGIVILLAGVAVAAYGLMRTRGRGMIAVPPVPLFPHLRVARVVEHLNGRVDLTENGYQSSVGDATGVVTFSMVHSDWQDRLDKYRKKYPAAENGPVSFNAGFAMLEGPVGLTFAAAQPLALEAGSGLWFRGDAADHDLFAATEGRQEGEWNPVVTYQLQEGRKPKTIPLWIVPSMAPSSDQRTLEIDLHWTQLRDRQGPEIELFDRIQLAVPTEWGNMVSASPPNATTTAPAPGQNFRIIEWQQVSPIDPDEYVQLKKRKSRPLEIRFEKPISAQSALSGRIEATFEGTLSGVHGIKLYLPGGGRADRQLARSAKTKVAVEFSVSLGAIRYQDDRVVPDENNAADENRSGLAKFAGVVPNSGVITSLTNEISKDDYYVKSVIEHAPFRDYSRAHVLNRVWDVAGRYYTGVFPIDFDIHVRGEEIQGASGTAAGNSSVQVTVKGSYATGGNSDGKLREIIEKKWDDLHGKVMKVFRERAAQAPAETDGTLGQPAALAVGPAVEPAAVERGGFAEPLAIGSAGVAQAVVVPSSPIRDDLRDKAELKSSLLRQWKLADEAVITGRISDEVYRAMITRIKAELRDLGEDLGE
jgi:hypothetical protein